MRARCPCTRFESGFISDLGLSTFGSSALHFQNFSFSAFQLLPLGVGQILVQAENFRKKFRHPAYPAFACALKTRINAEFQGSSGQFQEKRGEEAAKHRRCRTWSGTLHGRPGTGCPSYGEEVSAYSIRDQQSMICNPIFSAFLCDLGGLAVNLSERVGAARPHRPTGVDGAGA